LRVFDTVEVQIVITGDRATTAWWSFPIVGSQAASRARHGTTSRRHERQRIEEARAHHSRGDLARAISTSDEVLAANRISPMCGT